MLLKGILENLCFVKVVRKKRGTIQERYVEGFFALRIVLYHLYKNVALMNCFGYYFHVLLYLKGNVASD